MSAWSTLTVQNLAFVVQSAAFPADHLEARVEAFVDAMHSRLADLDEAAFASQVRAHALSLAVHVRATVKSMSM